MMTAEIIGLAILLVLVLSIVAIAVRRSLLTRSGEWTSAGARPLLTRVAAGRSDRRATGRASSSSIARSHLCRWLLGS